MELQFAAGLHWSTQRHVVRDIAPQGCIGPPSLRRHVLRRSAHLSFPAEFPRHAGYSRNLSSLRTWAVAGAQPLPEIPPGTVLHARYKVDVVLGRGANGVTYLCHDAEQNHPVAVKALSLRGLRDWKQLELFEREAEVLRNVNHPGVPAYIDSFEEDTANDRFFFLVQELADGTSLEAMVTSGWRADEAEVERIARELLDILRYLGSRRPAVVHRDVKPSNVVIEGGKTGGRVYLVDFGGVQAAASTTDDMFGSTIVGTYGFMSPEQFRGAAQPASDLYGLGATLLYLLSGRAPSAFPIDNRMRLDFSGVEMGPKLRAVVDGLLQPLLEDRISAAAALGVLLGRRHLTGGAMGGSAFRSSERQSNALSADLQVPRPTQNLNGDIMERKPRGSRSTVKKTGSRLKIDIPPAPIDADSIMTGSFAVVWNSFIAVWTWGALMSGGILFALFSLPFWLAGASLANRAFGSKILGERLEISSRTWKLQRRLAGFRPDGEADFKLGVIKETTGETRDLSTAELRLLGYVNMEAQTQIDLYHGSEKLAFGEFLKVEEQKWLVDVINQHLADLAVGQYAGVDTEDNAKADEYESRDFAAFDRKLGERIAQQVNDVARQAEKTGREARLVAEQTAERAKREGERAASRASDPSRTIDLRSGEFEVLD